MSGPGAYLFDEVEKNQVLEVLADGYLSRYGSESNPAFKGKVLEFEKQLSEFMDTNYTIAVNSGTSALMAALFALGIGPGDEVIVPGYTFIATMSAVVVIGAIPVLTEIDDSLTIDPEDIRKKITEKTKAIIPVHMIGNPSDMDPIMEISREFGIPVLEDAAQAVGASYKGRRVGSIGDIGAFSLNIYKVINTGDGGALVTNDKELYEKAFGFHDQGHRPLRMGAEIGTRDMIGINMRMNELSGAFALGQFSKLSSILELLKEKKTLFKKVIADAKLPHMKFRRINDPGECHTLCTLIFDSPQYAEKIAAGINAQTMDKSGWHVYNNMENILEYYRKKGYSDTNKKHCLPTTDDILSRSVNLSVGVVDKGIGANFGINILKDDEEILETAEKFVALARPILGG